MPTKRILVLEDEMLIAMDIEMTLRDAGHADLTVCGDVATALREIEADPPAAALLDFNLGHGETSIPVAERLHLMGRPFAFLSGYSDSSAALPTSLQQVERVEKPFRDADLVRLVADLLAGSNVG